METKTLDPAMVKTFINEKYTTHLKDSKKLQGSKGTLLIIEEKTKFIFLYSINEQLETRISDSKEIFLSADVICKNVNEIHKVCDAREGGVFVVNGFLDETVINELLKAVCSKNESCIKAIVCRNEVSDCELKPLDACYQHILQWMEGQQIGYLEMPKRGNKCDIQPGDIDVDGIPAPDLADLGHSDQRDPSLSQSDSKKPSELLYLINKTRRAHGCPEENPFLLPDVQPEGDNDLEEDAGVSESGVDENSSGEQHETFFLERDFETQKPSKTGTFSAEPEKCDTNVRNVTFLLNTPAAERVAEMGYASNDIEDAITKYTKNTADLKFGVIDLLDILEGKSPKQETPSV